jgi:SAM-dependent methyltransferase
VKKAAPTAQDKSLPDSELKQAVGRFWNATPCGTQGLDQADRRAFFATLERERDRLEPFIPEFAGFADAQGLRVLEIGVGAGTDFVRWLRAGARAQGIDLTQAGVDLTRERAALEGLQADVRVGDAERLPFEDAVFDRVYSYGVLHHTPDTPKAIAEVNRVLKPGGEARLMLYHYPSWAALNLWVRHALLKGRPWRSPRWAVWHFIESPGTKCYTVPQIRALMEAFRDVSVRLECLGFDMPPFDPSRDSLATLGGLARRLYPRRLVARHGRFFGQGALIRARR